MGACIICKQPGPYGYRRPGLLSEVSKGQGGTGWACSAHREQVQQMWQAKFGPAAVKRSLTPEPAPEPPKQGTLL